LLLRDLEKQMLLPAFRSFSTAASTYMDAFAWNRINLRDRRLPMKLYYSPGACSLAPHIALREAGLPFELDKVKFPAKSTQDGKDFMAVNPKGTVPVLGFDDGQILTEAAVILQYIGDKAPAKGLLPAAGTMERYRVQEWLNYVATELHKGFAPLFKATTPHDYKVVVKETLAKQFKYLDEQLTGRNYLTGDAFTVADAYLFTILNWSHFQQIDLKPYRNVSAFVARVAARPQVQAALKAEGLLKAA
jgi:glutathione S-transferase